MPTVLFGIVVLFAIAMFTLQLVLKGDVVMCDPSYLGAWDNLIHGHSHDWRPPVIPIILGICSSVAGVKAGCIIFVALNWIGWILTMRMVWCICGYLSLGSIGRISAVVLCMLVPGFWVANEVVQSESLCMTGFTYLLYMSCRFLAKPDYKKILYIGVATFLLIFAKPGFVFVLPIFALFWIFYWIYGQRRFAIAGLIGTAAVTLTVLAYIGWMNRSYKMHNQMTFAALVNRYQILRMEGLLRPENMVDSVAAKFRPFYEADPGHDMCDSPAYYGEIWSFSIEEYQDIVEEAERLYPAQVREAAVNRFVKSLTYDNSYLPDPGWEDRYLYPLRGVFTFPMAAAWLIGMILLVIVLTRWLRERKIPMGLYLLDAMLVSSYIVAVYASHDDWGRLVSPAMPCLAIASVFLISRLIRIFKR